MDEAKADSVRGCCNRDEGIGGTLCGRETEDQEVVVIVHEFHGRREELPDFGSTLSDEPGDLWIEFRDEAGNLLGG